VAGAALRLSASETAVPVAMAAAATSSSLQASEEATMKKQVIIASDGVTVANVINVADNATGDLIVPLACYVGPGMIWNGNISAPEFSQP
jgi:hypothetical protein